jgi:hypothetical protein
LVVFQPPNFKAAAGATRVAVFRAPTAQIRFALMSHVAGAFVTGALVTGTLVTGTLVTGTLVTGVLATGDFGTSATYDLIRT